MLSLVTLSFSLLLSYATAQSTAVTWIEPGPSAGSFAYAGEVLDSCPGTTVLGLQCTSAGSGAFTELCGTDGPVRRRHNCDEAFSSMTTNFGIEDDQETLPGRGPLSSTHTATFEYVIGDR